MAEGQEQDQDDKTEDPTARRLQKAREDGQVLRSQDATTAAVTLGVIACLYFAGSWFAPRFLDLFATGFVFDFGLVYESNLAVRSFGDLALSAFTTLSPLLLFAMILAVGTASSIGGIVFSGKAAAPKFSKLNPIKGLARIFGLRALVELSKAILKFGLVATFATIFLYLNLETFFFFGMADVGKAIASSLDLVLLGATITCLALFVIAAIDIPYQRFEFIKKLKMSKKDIKDELKDIEGQPEVRQKIRQKQRELSEQRMIDDVPKADVVITNPEHFAVALVYEIEKDGAPKVLAKGKGFTALKIREKAAEASVEIFEAPPLARALFFTVEVGQSIPGDLFQAVAQVIAYVYGLSAKDPRQKQISKPKPKVPRDLIFDEYGKRQLEFK